MAGQWQDPQWQDPNVHPHVQNSGAQGNYQQQWQPQYPPPPQNPYPPQHRYQPPRRGQHNPALWIIIAVAVIAAGGGGWYVLHGRAASAPQTCAQQYQAWKTGPANAAGKKLAADSAAVGKAGEDIKLVSAGLQAMGADATALQAYPMPACADPAGYWQQYLTAIRASGDNAGTASGLGGIILAEAPLKQVPGIQAKLTAELARTAGVKAT